MISVNNIFLRTRNVMNFDIAYNSIKLSLHFLYKYYLVRKYNYINIPGVRLVNT